MEKYIELNNGVKMPMIGFGTYQMPPRITQQCVDEAISLGYKHIDTAQCYYNEEQVGQAIAGHDDVFVTTKLWACSGYDDTLRSIDGSLQRLGRIDLILMHEPMGNVPEVYRAMETALKQGVVKAIGVANFLEDNYLKLLSNCEIIPAVDQIETHVFRQQDKMHRLLTEHGTVHESWSPLACGENNIFHNPVLMKIAKAHGKTVAQVALHWLLQRGIPVIPKSTHEERMHENLDISDFELTPAEMAEIATLDQDRSLFNGW